MGLNIAGSLRLCQSPQPRPDTRYLDVIYVWELEEFAIEATKSILGHSRPLRRHAYLNTDTVSASNSRRWSTFSGLGLIAPPTKKWPDWNGDLPTSGMRPYCFLRYELLADALSVGPFLQRRPRACRARAGRPTSGTIILAKTNTCPAIMRVDGKLPVRRCTAEAALSGCSIGK